MLQNEDLVVPRRIQLGNESITYTEISDGRSVIDGSRTFGILRIDFPLELDDSDAHPSRIITTESEKTNGIA